MVVLTRYQYQNTGWWFWLAVAPLWNNKKENVMVLQSVEDGWIGDINHMIVLKGRNMVWTSPEQFIWNISILISKTIWFHLPFNSVALKCLASLCLGLLSSTFFLWNVNGCIYFASFLTKNGSPLEDWKPINPCYAILRCRWMNINSVI